MGSPATTSRTQCGGKGVFGPRTWRSHWRRSRASHSAAASRSEGAREREREEEERVASRQLGLDAERASRAADAPCCPSFRPSKPARPSPPPLQLWSTAPPAADDDDDGAIAEPLHHGSFGSRSDMSVSDRCVHTPSSSRGGSAAVRSRWRARGGPRRGAAGALANEVAALSLVPCGIQAGCAGEACGLVLVGESGARGMVGDCAGGGPGGGGGGGYAGGGGGAGVL